VSVELKTRKIDARDADMGRKAREKGNIMISWALTGLVVALIAAVLGFGALAGTAMEIAKIIFVVAIVLFLISAITGVVRRGRS
jgi:uncharacterized membrane protein YtjA (UPF0391 family)